MPVIYASHSCQSFMPVIHASHPCHSSVPVIHASHNPHPPWYQTIPNHTMVSPTMGRFFRWKLRKHIDIPNFYRGQYHQTIFHDTYFSDGIFSFIFWQNSDSGNSDCIFSFIFWQKSSILQISLKKFLSSNVFEDFSLYQRIFVFGKYSEVSMVGRYVTSLYLPC